MKILKKYLLILLLVLSLLCNGILCYYLYETRKLSPSIMKLGFGNRDTVIYCEKSADIQSVGINTSEKIYTIGESILIDKEEALYFLNPKEQINLSDYEGLGFVINSDGELLYSLNKPCLKQQTVYITPSGKKYHTDPYCAGKTGFEIGIETAKLMREPCSLCV